MGLGWGGVGVGVGVGVAFRDVVIGVYKKLIGANKKLLVPVRNYWCKYEIIGAGEKLLVPVRNHWCIIDSIYKIGVRKKFSGS